MNKQEIEKQIRSYTAIRELSEERLDDLNFQLRDLAEAEKPKLGHGDWWLSEKRICIYMKEFNDKQRDFVALREYIITNIGSDYRGEPIQGNIFKLMEEWGKDFKEFKMKVYPGIIKPSSSKPYGTAK